MRQSATHKDLVHAVRLAAKSAREDPKPNPLFVAALEEAAEILESIRQQGKMPPRKRRPNTTKASP